MIAKHQSYFDNSNADIFHSKKGTWAFFRYDEQHNHYDCHIRFKTAEELERIILGEIADDANYALEIVAENINKKYDYDNIDSARTEADYQDQIGTFISNINCISEYMDDFKAFFAEIRDFRI